MTTAEIVIADGAEIDQNGRIVDAFALFIARDVKRSLASNDASALRLTNHARRIFSDMSLPEAIGYIRAAIHPSRMRCSAQATEGVALPVELA